MASIFLDWFRTIADQQATSRRYGEVMAELLHDWYALPLEEGVRVHDRALEWFMDEWPRRRDASCGYIAPAQELDTEHIYKVFELYGRPFTGSRDEAYALARRLTRAVASQIDTVYPDVRPALNELKRIGCRIYPATGADRNYLEGLLEASGLVSYFDEIITPDLLDVDKRRSNFWEAMLDRTMSSPRTSFVVDDDLRVLEVARTVGVHGVLVDRENIHPEAPQWVIRLGDLSGLPALVSEGTRSQE